MFRAIELSPEDRDLHHFVWRPNPDTPISDFRMTQVTFGVSSSPYLAIRTLQQTATSDHPSASYHVLNSFYVDDLLAGADTTEDALALFTSMRELLQKGGFDLRKWRSSSQEVTKSIPDNLLETVPVQALSDSKLTSHPKALGIEWNSIDDTMHVSITLPSKFYSTKRGVISDVAKTFDVLGWLAPIIVKMKILYQRLWKEQLEWDEPVPEPHLSNHLTWKEELLVLTELHIHSILSYPGTLGPEGACKWEMSINKKMYRKHNNMSWPRL